MSGAHTTSPLQTMTTWRKLHRNVLDYGYAHTLAKSAAFAARPIYHRAVYRIYGLDVQRVQVPEPSPRDDGFSVRRPRSNIDFLECGQALRGSLAHNFRMAPKLNVFFQ